MALFGNCFYFDQGVCFPVNAPNVLAFLCWFLHAYKRINSLANLNTITY